MEQINLNDEKLLIAFREKTKLIYKKREKVNKQLIKSTKSIQKSIRFNDNKFLKDVNDLLIKELEKICKEQSKIVIKRIFNKISSSLNLEFQQLCFLLKNINKIPKDYIKLDFEQIEEIWWTDNPDIIIKAKVDGTYVLIHIELTCFDYLNFDRTIAKNVQRHLREEKINNCLKIRCSLTNVKRKILIVLFSVWNSKNKRIYSVGDIKIPREKIDVLDKNINKYSKKIKVSSDWETNFSSF